EPFEWKLFDYDRPADLAARLRAAGFVPGGQEALMVAETDAIAQAAGRAGLPAGIRLEQVTGDAGLDLVAEVHGRVFGADGGRLRRSLAAQLARAPASVALVVAMAGVGGAGEAPGGPAGTRAVPGGPAVSAARAEFLPGSEFAGLWGGGTVPEWRGRGLYRALVGYRAGLAAARGYRYLQVDASPESRPILDRMGFACLALTTPYTWPAG
ncbi:MAG: hypothetical protein ACRDNF_13595, partial [Streptosporangiaceae bacterium]